MRGKMCGKMCVFVWFCVKWRRFEVLTGVQMSKRDSRHSVDFRKTIACRAPRETLQGSTPRHHGITASRRHGITSLITARYRNHSQWFHCRGPSYIKLPSFHWSSLKELRQIMYHVMNQIIIRLSDYYHVKYHVMFSEDFVKWSAGECGPQPVMGLRGSESRPPEIRREDQELNPYSPQRIGKKKRRDWIRLGA